VRRFERVTWRDAAVPAIGVSELNHALHDARAARLPLPKSSKQLARTVI